MDRKAIAMTGATLLFILGWSIAQNQVDALNLVANSQQSEESPSTMAIPQQASAEARLVNANTKFAFQLFSKIARQGKPENLFVSPSSVAIALSMAYNGAGGKTQQAMAASLGLQGMSLKEVNAANQALREALLKADPQVHLAIANSLWLRQGFSFKPQFLQDNQQYYQAKVTELDFASPKAISTINGWVKQETRGKIEQIVDSLKPSDVLFLINAIYFKGNWTTQFDPKLTAEKPFYLSNGKKKQHPMMSQTGEYRYYENEQFQAVSLPYGKGRLSMYIFLPRQNSNLDTFLGKLTPDNWNQWISKFTRREGSIQIPRFKFAYEIELKNALKALGMGAIFDSTNADFSRMSANPVYVNGVKHKTFVEVNEEGTEAAAVTSINIRATSVEISQPFRMVADRPFFCGIRDNQTGSILFMGAIVEPH